MKVDVFGHFGSRLSYATLTSEICRGLRDAGLLGRVTNLDDKWQEPHLDLESAADADRAKHCLVVTEPRHYYDALFSAYGRERVAMYSSGNTDTIAREHAQVLGLAGRVFVPSAWCAAGVRKGWEVHEVDSTGSVIEVMPLGVPATYQWSRERHDRLLQRCASNEPWTALHFSTDFVWPGRKGTDELLNAWKSLPNGRPRKLIVHVPRGVYEAVFYACSDLDIHDTVEILIAENRGTPEDELLAVFERADAIVLPSRCEGFGMMILAGLCLGIPTVTTAVTGQLEFLGDFGGWLSAPTTTPTTLAYEEGLAPEVMTDGLATVLSVAMTPDARRAMLLDALGKHDGDELIDHQLPWAKWTWSEARTKWTDTIRQWMEDT